MSVGIGLITLLGLQTLLFSYQGFFLRHGAVTGGLHQGHVMRMGFGSFWELVFRCRKKVRGIYLCVLGTCGFFTVGSKFVGYSYFVAICPWDSVIGR